jgi:uroporphyrin-III C-methyltransferase
LRTAESGTVYLVGAGPGDPELLTLKAANLLAQADIVLHDDLVPQPVLDLAAKHALIMSVGKRCGRKKITQTAIHELMISAARRGLRVVRLKSGDPLIFGRGGEEMDALREADVPFEVVPGVTAASAAAALLGASLTDRRLASKLVLLSGHHAATEPHEGKIGIGALPEDATSVLYMPGQNLAETAAWLIESGMSSSMPCVVVTDASKPGARYQACRLRGLGDVPPESDPRLLLIGRAFEPVLLRGEQASQAYLDSLVEVANSMALE